ncbi:MAG: hypothetical protein AAF447_22720 [Myxococcota bacterium]
MLALPRFTALSSGLLLALGLLATSGCNQNGDVSRLSGEGCQPACVRINTTASGDDDSSIECLDESLSSAACSGGLAGSPSCDQGTLTCMGGPVCVDDAGEMIGLPTCGL